MALTLQQLRQSKALHYKLYTGRCMLLHYNSPASRRPLHYKLLYLRHIHNTERRHQQSTTHYNEELPLSNKLGQVSAMASITSYVKDSLSKLNSARSLEVQI
ncbi:hypothetical protein KY284_026697 [Solanum tuberosum]|nr:hypothetical protein KY284_026697 [Solanum tuberosum]